MQPYQVIEDFEKALCDYTGSPYAVAVNSCTNALFLCVLRFGGQDIIIPKKTYVSVPMAILRAGGQVVFENVIWSGSYRLRPLPVWDSACRFTSGMYKKGQFQCVSFSAQKILGLEQGGAILHDDPEADKWFRKMRFDGRTEGLDPKDDHFDIVGSHCIMLSSTAAALLVRLYHLPKHNKDFVKEYPDLSNHPAFK